MTLTARMTLKLAAEHTNPLDLLTAEGPLALQHTLTLADGAGAGLANRLWTDRRTLAASATEDLDLAGTTLLDEFGAVTAFARIKALFIKASAANTNNVIVGAAAGTPWVTLLNSTGTVTIRPGGWIAVAAGGDATGYAVTATTADLLKIANSGAGTGVDYDIAVLGCAT